MNLFSAFRQKNIINRLLNAKDNEAMINQMTVLQNEMAVAFDTKVIGITSINDSAMAAAFGKALAVTFRHNGESCLVIDANLYEPRLGELSGLSPKRVEGSTYGKASLDEVDAILMEKTVYPGNLYKDGTIHNLIKEGLESHDHVIVLTPSLKQHKEIALLGDVLQAVILTVQKNYTRKENIYYAGHFLAQCNLPLAKTVVLK